MIEFEAYSITTVLTIPKNIMQLMLSNVDEAINVPGIPLDLPYPYPFHFIRREITIAGATPETAYPYTKHTPIGILNKPKETKACVVASKN